MGKRTALTKYQKITLEQLEAQVKSLTFKMDKSALNFSVAVAQRARTVFRNSFKYHRYYSKDGKPWKELSPNTIAKRRRKGTLGGGILREYRTLFNSIEMARTGNFWKTIGHITRQRVFTNPSNFDVSTNPHRGFCYAGVHNNPGPNDTYGNGFGGRENAVKAVQRQFMGFSTYIDSYIEENMNKYLFDSLFGSSEMIKVND